MTAMECFVHMRTSSQSVSVACRETFKYPVTACVTCVSAPSAALIAKPVGSERRGWWWWWGGERGGGGGGLWGTRERNIW